METIAFAEALQRVTLDVQTALAHVDPADLLPLSLVVLQGSGSITGIVIETPYAAAADEVAQALHLVSRDDVSLVLVARLAHYCFMRPLTTYKVAIRPDRSRQERIAIASIPGIKLKPYMFNLHSAELDAAAASEVAALGCVERVEVMPRYRSSDLRG